MVGLAQFITAKTDTSKRTSELSQIKDSEWMKSTFIVPDRDIEGGAYYANFIRRNRYYSTADYKYTSTSPGMSMAVNPKPQFTRYCDIRSKGRISSRQDISIGTMGHKNGLGMGHYYSEAIDDNQQRIFLRFGVPNYAPLLTWLAKSFDVDKVILQTRGVISSALLEAIGLLGKFWAIKTMPLMSLGMFAFSVVVQNTRFYSVKPTMYNYWATVENILNQMVARRTMVPYILQDYGMTKSNNPMQREQTISREYVDALNALIPDIVNETGRISVFAIALRSQAAFNRIRRTDFTTNAEGRDEPVAFGPNRDMTGYQLDGPTSVDGFFTTADGDNKMFTQRLFNSAHRLLTKDNPDARIVEMTSEGSTATRSSLMQFDSLTTDPNGQPLALSLDPNNPNDNIEARERANVTNKAGFFERAGEYMMAELSDGAAFAVFNVDNTGSVGESFTNSFEPNPIEPMFNAISSKARNIGAFLQSATEIPIVGDITRFIGAAGATFVSNATFGLANPLLALAYGVNITMPKQWEGSAATLPRASYKIKLISPYGNAYSQLFNIYLPLAMILAGSLPRSTGLSTYTSPFVCQLFDRGRVNINLGMIDSVSITRGTSNLPFSRNGQPNAIDIDLSIANMDEVISVDVQGNGVLIRLLKQFSPNFSDDPFTSYINTITGVDVYTQIYRIPQIRLKLAERLMVLSSVRDPAAMTAFAANATSSMGSGLARLILRSNQAAFQDLANR